MNSTNEWSPLKSVVVGSATGANWPSDDPVFATECQATAWTKTPVPGGPVPNWIVDEANQDLEALAETLTGLGIEVLRPRDRDFVAARGMYNYCPRDRLIVWGSTVVDPAMMYPCRDQEIECLDHVIARAARVLHMPRDQGLILDAANVLRFDDQWLVLESRSGNAAAITWLQQQLPEVSMERCSFYGGVHIDSTIVPIRPGLVVLNAARVNDSNCPKMFDRWTKIYVDSVRVQKFWQYPWASAWIALNLLVIDPRTVIMDADQHDLRLKLENHGVTVIPLTLRHSRTLGGGFHCVTLDIQRSNG